MWRARAVVMALVGLKWSTAGGTAVIEVEGPPMEAVCKASAEGVDVCVAAAIVEAIDGVA